MEDSELGILTPEHTTSHHLLTSERRSDPSIKIPQIDLG